MVKQFLLLAICAPIAVILLIPLLLCFAFVYLWCITTIFLFPDQQEEKPDFSEAQRLLDNNKMAGVENE